VAHPAVEEGENEGLEENVEGVDFGDDGLGPHALPKGQEESTGDAGDGAEEVLGAGIECGGFFFEGVEEVGAGATDEHGDDAASSGGGEGGEEVNSEGGVGLTVKGYGVKDPLEKPGEKGPDGIAGGVGYT